MADDGLLAGGLQDVVVFLDGLLGSATDAKAKMSTPILGLAGTSQGFIELTVTAGSPTGAPAGFSIQWETAAALALGPDGLAGTADDNTWFASDDARLCKASFSGNPQGSNYNLAAGETVTVRIGDLTLDTGASVSNGAGDAAACNVALDCGTEYVFHAFAHADNKRTRSDWTPDFAASTEACPTSAGGCTYTQGFWRTHGAAGPASEKIYDEFGNVIGYVSQWPVGSLTLGTVSYTEAELQSILDQAPKGNGLITLAHQLIAAKLSIANGADGTAVETTIADADALIGGLVVPPVGTGSLAAGATSTLVLALDDYANGRTGPGHCGDEIV
ncbi:MAG TPA: hypothetical protein VGR28_11670 [Candidatus Thermoplasmatota archaeon]|nr:hypothetical protein [Candidatus Thermoplasmatota archaeon]